MTPLDLASLGLGTLLGLGLLSVLLALGKDTTDRRLDSFPGARPTSAPPTRSRAKLWQGLSASLDRAGMGQIRPGLAVGLGGVLSLVVAVLTYVLIPIPVLAPLAGLASVFAARAYLRSQVAARERRLRATWPGLVDHIRSAIRSGASVAESVVLLADRVPTEIRPAFVRYRESVSGGVRVDAALGQLKATIANPVADRIIEALRMSHEVGGRELPSVMQSLQVSLRADIAVREDALAKQSWIRAASRLGVAAPWLVLVLLSGRQETVSAYSTPEGSAIVVAGAVLSVVAFTMMSKLGTLPREQRWFAG
jgi:tight adherence protein B